MFLFAHQAFLYRGAGAEQRVLQQPEPSAEAVALHVHRAVSQLRARLLLHHRVEQRGQCLGHIAGPAHARLPLGYVVHSKTNQEVLDDRHSLHRGMNNERSVFSSTTVQVTQVFFFCRQKINTE